MQFLQFLDIDRFLMLRQQSRQRTTPHQFGRESQERCKRGKSVRQRIMKSTMRRGNKRLALPEWDVQITRLRERMEVNQAELARRMECSAMTISRWRVIGRVL
jgi:hypothetical protein